jgi:hypothetical protein
MLRTVIALCLLAAPAWGQDVRHVAVAQAQTCQQGPAWSPGVNDGEYEYWLPPDVPNPVAIAEAGLDIETGWPANATSPGGVWLVMLDRSQTYFSCSHWPGAQDCPAIGQSQWAGLDTLTSLAVGDPRQSDFRLHNPPVLYHKGDAILYQMSCNVPIGQVSNVIGGFSIGLIRPTYTPSTACDTNTKLLLHGGQFSNPINLAPLQYFVSDASPAWHAIGSGPTNAQTDVTIDTATPTAIPSPLPTALYSALAGNSSIHFDGQPNSIAWAQSSGDWKVNGGDWTLELFWRPGSVAPGVVQSLVTFTTYGPFSIGQVGTAVMFSSSSTGAGWDVAASVPFATVALGTWSWLMIERQGNSIFLVQDGVLKTTIPVTGALFDPPQSSLGIGNQYGSLMYPATGNLQELRFSKVARYPGGVATVPMSPFPCP